MGKNKPTRAQLSAAIDPRFMGTFNRSSTSSDKKDSSLENKSQFKKERTHVDENQGFREFLSKKLFEYLESQIQEIDPPNEAIDSSFFEPKNVTLFEGSEILTEINTCSSSNDLPPPPKKKKKKDKDLEKERLREAAISPEWVYQQAKLLNS